MALFFDQDWFQARLDEANQTHDALAQAAGLTLEELAAVWKDQMEITGEMIEGFAQCLGTDLLETAGRCGLSAVDGHDFSSLDVSAQEPVGDAPQESPDHVLNRLARLEKTVASLQTMVENLVAAKDKP